MDLKTEKLDVLQTIINSDDEALVHDIKTFLDERKADWFDELDAEQKSDVLSGIEQAEGKEVVPHQEVAKLFSKWGLK